MPQAALRQFTNFAPFWVNVSSVLERFPTSAVAPEAQYFLAVSAYKQSHQASDLLDNWHRLQMRYPDSLWRVKQLFVEEG